MGYSFRHFLFLLRKNVLRKESKPGNLKRMLGAFFLSMMTLVLGGLIPEHLDESLLIKSLFSLRHSIFGEAVPPDNVVIIKIDDTSYRKLGLSTRKPFPREIGARAVRSLMKDEPKLVILDLYFPEEEDEKIATKLFADALSLGVTSIAKPPMEIRNINKDDEKLYASEPLIAEAAKYELPMTLSSLFGLTLYMNLDIPNYSPDNIYKSVPLLKPLHDIVDENIPAPSKYSLINYYGAEGRIRSFSLWELFEGELFEGDRLIPSGFFKDKIIFIGFKSELRARGHSDKEVLGVPVKSGRSDYEMYGVEIHATILSNLLDSSWISRVEPSIEVISKFLLMLFLFLGIISFHPVNALIYMISFLSLWFLTTFILFTNFLLFAPGVFLALLFAPFIFAGAACVNASLAMKELKELKKTFGIS